MSVFRVILVRIQSECGKMETRITPKTDIFDAVYPITMLFKDTINPLQLLVEKCKFFSQNYQ